MNTKTVLLLFADLLVPPPLFRAHAASLFPFFETENFAETANERPLLPGQLGLC